MIFKLKYLFVILILFFSGGAELFSPVTALAEAPATPTCNCFFEGSFSETTDCQPVPLPVGGTQDQCNATCEKKFAKSLKQVFFTNNPEEKASSAASCTKIHTENGATADASAAIPKLEVPIPGVAFTAPVKSAKLLSVSFLAQYISGFYKYLLSIAGVIAIVMVMIGGFQYVLGAGAKGQLDKGKERIGNGVIGLILLLSVYFILYTVNPQLSVFKPLTIEVIQEMQLEKEVSGEFAKKLLKDFPDAPPKYIEPVVPSASTCARQSKLATQADRDAAFAIQQQTGYPAAVLLAQRLLEGATFGIKCGPFKTAKKGDKNAVAELNCEGKGTQCGYGFTWECTKNLKYLPPANPGSGSPPDGSDCGKGDKKGQGYTAVYGYACFKKADPNNPFGPLINFYNKYSCYGAAKAKYGGNPEAFAYAVQACGYATDHGYAGALVARMKKFCLYTGEIKKPPTEETSNSSDDIGKEE